MHNIKLYDSYRGLAAIVVFSSHLCLTFLFPYMGSAGKLFNAMSLLSTWAVNIFFLLSGYLITFSILRNISKNGYFKWQDFMISRIARIYPPLIASLMICILLYWVFIYFDLHGKYSFRLSSDLYVIREKFSLEYREIADSLLMRGGMLSVNGPLWSLYVEVKIYLIAMLIAILIASSMRWWIKFAAFALLISMSIKLTDSLIFVIIWVLGSVFALTLQHIKRRTAYGNIMKLLYSFAFIVFLYYAFDPMVFIQNNKTYDGFFATIALSFLLAGLIFKWQIGTKLLYIFSPTAKFSYTLYVIHFPLLLFIFSLTHQMLSSNFNFSKLFVVSGLVFAITISSAYAIASYFEDKKRFEYFIRKIINILNGIHFAKRTNI